MGKTSQHVLTAPFANAYKHTENVKIATLDMHTYNSFSKCNCSECAIETKIIKPMMPTKIRNPGGKRTSESSTFTTIGPQRLGE